MSTKLKYFDAHTHINMTVYADDYKEVVSRALGAGVGMVNVGTQKDTSLRAVTLAHEYENQPVYAAVGLHPVHTGPSFHDETEIDPLSYSRELESGGEVFDYEYYKTLAEDSKVVAIGECGLDYFHLPEGKEEETKQKQKEVFLMQMKLAQEVGKPLMIHCRSGVPKRASSDKAGRDAYYDLLEILKTQNYLPTRDIQKGHKLKTSSIMHFFAGTVEEAKRFLDLGFSFTFGGAVTFPFKKNTPDYAAIVTMLPPDRILSETDAPYVAPVPYRGKRNEPLYVIETVKKLAEIKGISVEEMASITTENAKKVFGI